MSTKTATNAVTFNSVVVNQRDHAVPQHMGAIISSFGFTKYFYKVYVTLSLAMTHFSVTKCDQHGISSSISSELL
jgi:hypothetical protein